MIPDGVLGMLIFVVCEVMFFAALFSAYLVVSAGATEWPPADQPRLPVATTAFNTVVLLLSGWLMFQSNRRLRSSGAIADAQKLMGWSILCGAFFVAFQGIGWMRLLSYGLTMQSSSYGSFFYLIVGPYYLVTALVMGGIYLFKTVQFVRGEFSKPQARRLFLFSILHLTVVYTMLFVDCVSS